MKNSKGFFAERFFRKPFSQKGFCAKRFFSQGFLRQQKGFLGPIGDDLPSLIPLVFSLIIFFGAFGVAFSTFSQRGRDFDLQIEALRISTELKGNNYFSNFAEFEELCDSIIVKGIKFRGGMVNIGKPVNIFDPEFYAQGTGADQRVFKCENTSEKLLRAQLSQQRPITRDFPVVLNEDFVVNPKTLVITVWR